MPTIQEVAEKFEVSTDQVKQLKEGMSIVWDIIGYDCYEFLDSYGSETEMIAEMTLDAGRLKEYTRIRETPEGVSYDWTWLEAKNLDVMKLGEATWNARY
jgi:hypothetical protein